MLHVLYNYVDLPLGRFTLQYIPNYGENMNIQENFHKNCSNCTNEISTSNFDIWRDKWAFLQNKKRSDTNRKKNTCRSQTCITHPVNIAT